MELSNLYDSENYVVVHVELGPGSERPGFEIVDKKAETSVFLCDRFAEGFSAQLKLWQAKTPEQDEVESVLAGYASVALLPLCCH